MGNRLTRIYTRTGDDGTTGLGDGSRADKDAPRLAAIGDVDELNSALALVLAASPPPPVVACLEAVQHDLFTLGGELSLPGQTLLSAGDVERLEQAIDGFNAELPPLREFILPGGGQAAAACHLARAICRRAERSVVALARVETVGVPLRRYLNRLSDLLFVLARVLARDSGAGEVYWRKRDEY
ncbi:cob(I)yrinic acid a,c-diamide adenosyltransferase [Acidihalobacter ferrooxydans]|uniref:Corrinoid adenosyltransferase n=1 Tax=Acidihalobacter ferrooxydans TaxID=1765967 RepID=A0A1P8UJ11_9GAMM|nr:cob(I)yrinic acid a,c-diamide adenosyltransferase [Acidihalobacter ferrooxydans]APZ43835.1 ATP:cob(I)alamin adenosyltransferase [Acidihalobacter ferrooxydans]